MHASQMGPTAAYVIVEPYRDRWMNLKSMADIAIADKWALEEAPDPSWTDAQIVTWQVDRTEAEGSWDLGSFNAWHQRVSYPGEGPPANEPQYITVNPHTVANNVAKGTTIGTVQAAGGTTPYVFTLVNNPSVLYVIEGTSLKTNKNDAGGVGYHLITVRVKDANNFVYDEELTIVVT